MHDEYYCEDSNSQPHIFECPFLDTNTIVTNLQAKYHNIFSDRVDKQIEVIRIFSRRLKSRNIMSSQEEDPGDPGVNPDARDQGMELQGDCWTVKGLKLNPTGVCYSL